MFSFFAFKAFFFSFPKPFIRENKRKSFPLKLSQTIQRFLKVWMDEVQKVAQTLWKAGCHSLTHSLIHSLSSEQLLGVRPQICRGKSSGPCPLESGGLWALTQGAVLGRQGWFRRRVGSGLTSWGAALQESKTWPFLSFHWTECVWPRWW